MNLVDITRLSNGPIRDLISWLQRENLIANPLRCLPCNRGITLTDIYGKLYIIIICFRDVGLVNYLISPYVKRLTWPCRPV